MHKFVKLQFVYKVFYMNHSPCSFIKIYHSDDKVLLLWVTSQSGGDSRPEHGEITEVKEINFTPSQS